MKVKLSLCLTNYDYVKVCETVEIYLNVFVTSDQLYPRRKSARYPLDRTLGRSQSREKKSLPLLLIEPQPSNP
jgi:hypothetical protein